MEKIESQVPQNNQLASIGELYGKAFDVYKKNFWKFVILILLQGAIVFACILAGFVGIAIEAILYHSVGIGVAVGVGLLFVVLAVVAMVFGIIYFTKFKIGSMFLVTDEYQDKTVAEVIKLSEDKVWQYIAIGLLTGIFVFLWFLLLIVPGIVMAIYYSMAVWVLLIEGVNGMAAIKRSKQLIKGHWWAVVGRVLAGYALIIALYFVVALITGDTNNLNNKDKSFSASDGIVQFIVTLFGPFFMAYMYQLYKSLASLNPVALIPAETIVAVAPTPVQPQVTNENNQSDSNTTSN